MRQSGVCTFSFLGQPDALQLNWSSILASVRVPCLESQPDARRGHESGNLIADEENGLSPKESETEPHVYVFTHKEATISWSTSKDR